MSDATLESISLTKDDWMLGALLVTLGTDGRLIFGEEKFEQLRDSMIEHTDFVKVFDKKWQLQDVNESYNMIYKELHRRMKKFNKENAHLKELFDSLEEDRIEQE